MGIGSICNGSFKFSYVVPDELGETEYCLVTILFDVTGSVAPFAKAMRDALILSIKDLQKHPKSYNVLLRFVTFGLNGVVEVFGYKELHAIDFDKDIPVFRCDGRTPLFDAFGSAIASFNSYSEDLTKKDFDTNGIIICITDGDNNDSHTFKTAESVGEALKNSSKIEVSKGGLTTILIGVNLQDKYFKDKLENFQKEAGIDAFRDIKDVRDGSVAHLAGFISQSVSSQMNYVGTSSRSVPTF